MVVLPGGELTMEPLLLLLNHSLLMIGDCMIWRVTYLNGLLTFSDQLLILTSMISITSEEMFTQKEFLMKMELFKLYILLSNTTLYQTENFVLKHYRGK